MTELSTQAVFQDRTSAFKELQQANFKLWQWLDNVTTVWWAPGRLRVIAREDESGQITVNPLPPLDWFKIDQAVGTVAAMNTGKKLVKEDFKL